MNILSSSKKIKESKVKDYIVENQERFYKIAYSYVKNEDDALDIVHDAICKALYKIDSLKDIEVVKSWFYKILINRTIDYIRKNKKYVINNDLKAIYYAMEDKFYVATYSKRDRDYINKLLLANYKEYIKFDDAMCFEQNVLFDFAESGCDDFNYFIED